MSDGSRVDASRIRLSHHSPSVGARSIIVLPVALAWVVAAIAPAAGWQEPDQALSARIDSLAAATFEDAGPGGVIVVARNGEVHFRRAYGMADLELGVRMTPEHIFRIGSITKQFTAVAILLLVQRGQVGLDEDLRRYVPDLLPPTDRITAEQVLTHTSGLPNLVDLERFEELARQDHTPAGLVSLTQGQPLWFEPGSGFRYSDTGYILLGILIERLGGLPYGKFLEQNIFEPLGMTRTFYGGDVPLIPGRVPGYSRAAGAVTNASFLSMTVPHAAGALVSSADDLLRWTQALRNGALVDSTFLARAWSGRTLPDGTRSGYGFGWKTCRLAGHRTVEHGGFVNGFGANVIHLPDDDLTVVVLVNQDADRPDAGNLARRIGRLLLVGEPMAPYVRLSGPEREVLMGNYEVRSGAARTFFESGDSLFVRAGSGAVSSLEALSGHELTLATSEGAFTFEFRFDADGRADAVRAFNRCEPVFRAYRKGGPHGGGG